METALIILALVLGFIYLQFNKPAMPTLDPVATRENLRIPASFITTNFALDGYRISENLGVVRGITVRSRSIVGNWLGGLQTLLGGNISIYEELCETARQHAYAKMIEHAQVLGANAVIGFRFDATELMPGLTEVLAYGTACKVEKI